MPWFCWLAAKREGWLRAPRAAPCRFQPANNSVPFGIVVRLQAVCPTCPSYQRTLIFNWDVTRQVAGGIVAARDAWQSYSIAAIDGATEPDIYKDWSVYCNDRPDQKVGWYDQQSLDLMNPRPQVRAVPRWQAHSSTCRVPPAIRGAPGAAPGTTVATCSVGMTAAGVCPARRACRAPTATAAPCKRLSTTLPTQTTRASGARPLLPGPAAPTSLTTSTSGAWRCCACYAAGRAPQRVPRLAAGTPAHPALAHCPCLPLPAGTATPTSKASSCSWVSTFQKGQSWLPRCRRLDCRPFRWLSRLHCGRAASHSAAAGAHTQTPCLHLPAPGPPAGNGGNPIGNTNYFNKLRIQAGTFDWSWNFIAP